MSGETVLVTGATGNVGRVVVERLLGAGVKVRAAGRTADAVRGLFGDRVEAVAFDFTDDATWAAAFDGITRMFLLRPPHLGKPKREMLPALESARSRGVRHMVFLSLQGADTNKVVPHAAIETWLRESGLRWTFVRASFFHQNLSTTHVTDVRDRGEIMVPAGGGATAFVDVEDVGSVAAAALIDPASFADVRLTVTGEEALTYAQIAAILTDELGKPITYERPGIFRYALHARKHLGMPWEMVLVTAAIYTTARLGMADGLTGTVREVLGRAPITFADFASREREVWRASATQPERTTS